MIVIKQEKLLSSLERRQILAENIDIFHTKAITQTDTKSTHLWTLQIGNSLLFDVAGLNVICNAIRQYQGLATKLNFTLSLLPLTIRDYYSHHPKIRNNRLELPVIATRAEQNNKNSPHTIILELPILDGEFDFPNSLTPTTGHKLPLALLMHYSCDHDILFANQIAIFSKLILRIKRSPLSLLRGLFSRLPGNFRKRISLCYQHIHPHTQIHPTAVIEGSIIAAGCRIGAFCVVRYSVLGTNVQLFDGAKVEFSVLGDHSWLMHDLVLYRSVTERHVFLIHGPYQFSYFQHQSAAFASIMMDYRPDERNIRINTSDGVRDYQGRFLGALLEEKSKVLGGTLTAPGITIPAGKQLAADTATITRAKDLLNTKTTC